MKKSELKRLITEAVNSVMEQHDEDREVQIGKEIIELCKGTDVNFPEITKLAQELIELHKKPDEERRFFPDEVPDPDPSFRQQRNHDMGDAVRSHLNIK